MLWPKMAGVKGEICLRKRVQAKLPCHTVVPDNLPS